MNIQKKRISGFLIALVILVLAVLLLFAASWISYNIGKKQAITKSTQKNKLPVENSQELKLRKKLAEYEEILDELSNAQRLENQDGSLKKSKKVNEELSDIALRLWGKTEEFRLIKDSIYNRGLKKDSVVCLQGMEQMNEAINARVLGATNFLRGKEEGNQQAVQIGLKDFNDSIKMEEKARKQIDKSGF